MPATAATNIGRRGINPMIFPKDDVVIAVTEKELRAQGVKFCLRKIQAHNQCLVKSKEEYLKRGLDTSNGPEWYYFHLQRCFEPHKAANQCVIDHREQELRERRKRIREKKLGSSIHV